MNNAQVLALLLVLALAVLAGLSIGWAIWGRPAAKHRRYQDAHNAMVPALFLIADPHMHNPDSMRVIATRALAHEVL